jgi:origin recognition complex subunit 6
MNRGSIEQALTGLMPTLNGPLPPELMDLALSFLARSRNVAQSLKQDEEIARPYACAQLACERLDTGLDPS